MRRRPAVVSVNLPVERPLSRGAYCYCDGPVAFASTQIQRFSDRWVCWVASAGMRYGKLADLAGLGDAEGTANELFIAGERPAVLSFSFDQDARPVIAIQQTPTAIEVRRKVSGVVTSYIFNGISPQLFYNGIVVASTTNADVVCFYIKAAGDAIYARFQRDNFAIEYTLNSIAAIELVALLKVDRLHKDGSDYCFLFALDSFGRQVVFKSLPFPAFPLVILEPAYLTIGFQGGTTNALVLIAVMPTEKSTAATAFGSGVYFAAVISASQPVEKTTGTLSFSAGVYTLTVLAVNQGADKGSQVATFSAGNYVQQIVSGGTFLEKSSGSIGFQSGNYS